MTSSITSTGTPPRATASRTTCAARSSGRTPARPPPYLPCGVRTPPIRKASGIGAHLIRDVVAGLQREEPPGDEPVVGQRRGGGRIGGRAVQIAERRGLVHEHTAGQVLR